MSPMVPQMRFSQLKTVVSAYQVSLSSPLGIDATADKSASDINLVGERFHRVQSVSRSHEGTGIGLALIKVRPFFTYGNIIFANELL